MAKKQPTKTYQELKQSLDLVLNELQHEGTDIDAAIILHKQGQVIIKELNSYLKLVAEHAEIEIKKVN